MRALQAATIAMGVLIIAGTAALVVLIAQRAGGHPTAATRILDQPPGTRIAGIATAGTALALSLQGGGPDRILILDPRSLRITGQATLAR